MRHLKLILTCSLLLLSFITPADDLSDLKAQAQAGDAEVQFTLGDRYENGEDKVRDEKQAVYWYTRAAEQGHAVAQHHLGGMYFAGKAVTKDEKQGVSWYMQAAAQGYAESQSVLGMAYLLGRGVDQN